MGPIVDSRRAGEHEGAVTAASAIDRAARAAAGRGWLWVVALAALAGWPVVHALRTRMLRFHFSSDFRGEVPHACSERVRSRSGDERHVCTG